MFQKKIIKRLNISKWYCLKINGTLTNTKNMLQNFQLKNGKKEKKYEKKNPN